jgi:hypothetical protein
MKPDATCGGGRAREQKTKSVVRLVRALAPRQSDRAE